MKACIVILALVGIGVYIQNTVDFGQIKQGAMNSLQNQKTINTVNSSRAQSQSNIYNATNR